ncbi:MAG TPA: HU family DNA-binding protein [Paludibacter sp.]|nr:HU family DNA-binding protein [Paludibacter sp.]
MHQKSIMPKLKVPGILHLKQISREIAENSTTVSDTDVLAVLNDLTKILNRHLKNGEIVRFGDFGTFQINIKSEGAETEDKFNQTMITDTKVTYRPGSVVREMLNNIKFEKL